MEKRDEENLQTHIFYYFFFEAQLMFIYIFFSFPFLHVAVLCTIKYYYYYYYFYMLQLTCKTILIIYNRLNLSLYITYIVCCYNSSFVFLNLFLLLQHFLLLLLFFFVACNSDDVYDLTYIFILISITSSMLIEL